MFKICSIIGARPQFVKAAPLSRELRKKFKEIIIHTGQHYDSIMSDIFFSEMKIPRPDYNLEVGSGSHASQTAAILKGLEAVLQRINPDLVIIYGDTNTTLAGALAASKLHIPIAHIEAGMRSFNKRMPEEINRIVADHVADIEFCSTETAVNNLHHENIRKNVYLVGDIMVDSLKQWYKVAIKKSSILKKLSLRPKQYYLSTVHRAENTESTKSLNAIFQTLLRIPHQILMPLHPRTWKMLPASLWQKIEASGHLKIIKPVGYLDMLILQKNARAILTDSGGIQKEAYVLKTPCLTLRNETEWVESLRGGWNQLVGTNQYKIKRALRRHPRTSVYRNVFGRGDTAKRIAKILYEHHRI